MQSAYFRQSEHPSHCSDSTRRKPLIVRIASPPGVPEVSEVQMMDALTSKKVKCKTRNGGIVHY
jgi:hypothetical protein